MNMQTPMNIFSSDAPVTEPVQTQEKLRPDLAEYLAALLKLKPRNRRLKLDQRNLKMVLAPLIPKVEGMESEAAQFIDYIDQLVQQGLKDNRPNASIIFNIFFGNRPIQLSYIPNPQETAFVGFIDAAGTMRSYLVPAANELPHLQNASVPAGVIFICQPAAMLNPTIDNRDYGLIAVGPWGDRTRDPVIGAEEIDPFVHPSYADQLNANWATKALAVDIDPSLEAMRTKQHPSSHIEEEELAEDAAVVGAAAEGVYHEQAPSAEHAAEAHAPDGDRRHHPTATHYHQGHGQRVEDVMHRAHEAEEHQELGRYAELEALSSESVGGEGVNAVEAAEAGTPEAPGAGIETPETEVTDVAALAAEQNITGAELSEAPGVNAESPASGAPEAGVAELATAAGEIAGAAVGAEASNAPGGEAPPEGAAAAELAAGAPEAAEPEQKDETESEIEAIDELRDEEQLADREPDRAPEEAEARPETEEPRAEEPQQEERNEKDETIEHLHDAKEAMENVDRDELTAGKEEAAAADEEETKVVSAGGADEEISGEDRQEQPHHFDDRHEEARNLAAGHTSANHQLAHLQDAVHAHEALHAALHGHGDVIDEMATHHMVDGLAGGKAASFTATHQSAVLSAASPAAKAAASGAIPDHLVLHNLNTAATPVHAAADIAAARLAAAQPNSLAMPGAASKTIVNPVDLTAEKAEFYAAAASVPVTKAALAAKPVTPEKAAGMPGKPFSSLAVGTVAALAPESRSNNPAPAAGKTRSPGPQKKPEKKPAPRKAADKTNKPAAAKKANAPKVKSASIDKKPAAKPAKMAATVGAAFVEPLVKPHAPEVHVEPAVTNETMTLEMT